jgi:RNA ligase
MDPDIVARPVGIGGYGSPVNLGHKSVLGVLDGDVVIQEKVDGSQFSFGLREGVVCCRSKGVQIHIEDPGMFRTAVETAVERRALLKEGWTYRGEFLGKPKHNILAYGRVPRHGVVLFDVDRGDQDYLGTGHLRSEATRLDLECVPVFHEGPVSLRDDIEGWLKSESFLGGVLVEGVVVKNYAKFNLDHKVMMAKVVSAAFKETHVAEGNRAYHGDSPEDLLRGLMMVYRTEPRWLKARQHLLERGEILPDGRPQDIGPMIREIQEDVARECVDEIKERLWTWMWPKIRQGITYGFPDWYKSLLITSALQGVAQLASSADTSGGTPTPSTSSESESPTSSSSQLAP